MDERLHQAVEPNPITGAQARAHYRQAMQDVRESLSIPYPASRIPHPEHQSVIDVAVHDFPRRAERTGFHDGEVIAFA